MNKHKIEIKSLFHAMNSPRWIAMVFILPLLAAAHFALAQTTGANTSSFNHIQTGFILSGPHATAPCESCHVQGVFKGTPRDCATCHSVGNRMGATAKPNMHIPTAAPCNNCHRPTTWVPATFSHVGISPGACLTCHNSMTAAGKPNGHVLTTASCDTCHRTVAWIPAGYDHTGIAPGTCATCHGVTATGKPNGHIATADSCDKCHSTRAWLPAGYNHVGVVPGTCANCHNGTTAKGKTSNHVPTTGVNTWPSCDSCHNSTTSFANARLHSSVTVATGTCTQCHERGNPYGLTGRPSGHSGSMGAPNSCDNGGCHSTSTFNK